MIRLSFEAVYAPIKHTEFDCPIRFTVALSGIVVQAKAYPQPPPPSLQLTYHSKGLSQ